MSQTLVMREYINTLESSYKQQLVSSTMLSEAGVSFLSKITSLLSSLKGVSLFVFKLLAEVAMETWRHKGKAAIAAGMWFSGTLEPVYNFFKHIAHLSINWSGLWNDFQKLQEMSTKIAGYSIWTPGKVEASWNQAWSIVSKHLATPAGGWTADSLKKILQGAGAQEQQIVNAVYHLAVEFAVPMAFAFWFLKVVHTAWIKSRGGKEKIYIDKIMSFQADQMQAMQAQINSLEQREKILRQFLAREFPQLYILMNLSDVLDIGLGPESSTQTNTQVSKTSTTSQSQSSPQQPLNETLQEQMRHLINKVYL